MHQWMILSGMLLWFASCGGRTAREAADDQAGDTGVAVKGDTAPTPAGAQQETQAALRDPAGRSLGVLSLRDAQGGVMVSGTLRGLAPGVYAIHLHMSGRCEPPYESAGDHWNPTGRQHGLENPAGPHFGDLPNVTVGVDSTAEVGATTPGGTVRGATPLLDQDGASVVLHAGADDNRTDPSGKSGDRIACGVVTAM